MDWLICDADFLAHRAFHSRIGMSHDENPTGTIFGFLSDVISLSNRFMTTKLAFCWDSRQSKRAEIYPNYRKKRKGAEYTEGELKEREWFHQQRKLLRKVILPQIGWSNSFWQDGYEADDLIASILHSNPMEDNVVIVSADKDLYQLLKWSGVTLYNPITKRDYRASDFYDEFQTTPGIWPRIKAIAGCDSDSIEGIEGVGEITAAKYLRGELAKGKKYEAIQAGKEIIDRNLKLVTLPFPGTKKCILEEPKKIDNKGWKEVCRKYGVKQLESRL